MIDVTPRIVSKAEARKRAAKDFLVEIDEAVWMNEERVREFKSRGLKNNVTLYTAILTMYKKIQALLVREVNAAEKEMEND